MSAQATLHDALAEMLLRDAESVAVRDGQGVIGILTPAAIVSALKRMDQEASASTGPDGARDVNRL